MKKGQQSGCEFIERFKGKISVVDKGGHIGIVASSSKPIRKNTDGSNHNNSNILAGAKLQMKSKPPSGSQRARIITDYPPPSLSQSSSPSKPPGGGGYVERADRAPEKVSGVSSIRRSLTTEGEGGFHPDSLALASQSYFNMVREKEGPQNYQSMGKPFYPGGSSTISHSPNPPQGHSSTNKYNIARDYYAHSTTHTHPYLPHEHQNINIPTNMNMGGLISHSFRTPIGQPNASYISAGLGRLGGSGYGHASFNPMGPGPGHAQEVSFTPRISEGVHRSPLKQEKVEPFANMKPEDLSPRMLGREAGRYEGFAQASKDYRRYQSLQHKGAVSIGGDYPSQTKVFEGSPIHSTGKFLVNPLERHNFGNSMSLHVTRDGDAGRLQKGYYVPQYPSNRVPKGFSKLPLGPDPSNMNKSPSLSVLDVRNNQYKNNKVISQLT